MSCKRRRGDGDTTERRGSPKSEEMGRGTAPGGKNVSRACVDDGGYSRAQKSSIRVPNAALSRTPFGRVADVNLCRLVSVSSIQENSEDVLQLTASGQGGHR